MKKNAAIYSSEIIIWGIGNLFMFIVRWCPAFYTLQQYE